MVLELVLELVPEQAPELESALEPELGSEQALELEPLLEDYAPDAEPIWAVYPQRRHLQPKISALIDLLRLELPAALARTRD